MNRPNFLLRRNSHSFITFDVSTSTVTARKRRPTSKRKNGWRNPVSRSRPSYRLGKLSPTHVLDLFVEKLEHLARELCLGCVCVELPIAIILSIKYQRLSPWLITECIDALNETFVDCMSKIPPINVMAFGNGQSARQSWVLPRPPQSHHPMYRPAGARGL
jgi:hypothetical protein